MQIKKSHNLNLLAESLINELLNKKDDFFSCTTVVCPNRNVQQWFKSYWLNNKSEILMNVNFVNLEDFLLSIFDTDHHLANSSDYKNIIIKILSNQTYDETYPEIQNYLFDDVGGVKAISCAKLYELATTLSSLFIEYEKEELNISGWQKELYETVLLEFDRYQLTTLSKLFNEDTNIVSSDQTVYLFGFVSLEKLYEGILYSYSKQSNVVLYQLEESSEFEHKYNISSSPSITKEIEVVHSIICDLLKNNDNKPTDFVVVGTSMSDYENVIKKTFNQNDEDFPYIPYSISGSKSEDSDLAIALKLLIEIVNKGFLSRLDFFSLVSNNLVKFVRNITDEQIDKWMQSIHALNVYRGDGSTNDNWDYIRKRMLLSKISDVSFDDNIVIMNDEDTIPYSSIGLDNESIISFVSVIDDLKSWITLFNNANLTDKETLLSIKAEVKKWFCSPVLSNVDKRYKKADDLINYWLEKDIVAPVTTLLFLILDVTKLKSISYREPFTTGVTFVEFNPEVVYSQKYVFFINLGSNSLPSSALKSELDLGTLKDQAESEKKAFLLQYHNGNHVFFSFISADLKKDAELFESTFSKNLRTSLLKQINPNNGESESDYEKRISKLLDKEVDNHKIDETRTWDKLYTRAEYNNKDYREGLLSIKTPQHATENKTIVPEQEEQEIRTKVSVSDLSKLLEEPLSARANYLFGSEDDSNEKNHDEFEGFTLDSLENYLIVSSLTEKRVRHAIDNSGTPFDNSQFEKQLQLENKIPSLNKNLESIAFEGACDKVDTLLGHVGVESSPEDYELLRLQDLSLNCNGQDWTLVCNKVFIRKEVGNEITYYELKGKNKKKNIKYLVLYVISLMDVAQRNDSVEYHIILDRFDVESFVVTSVEAKEILNRLYELLNKYDDLYFAYLDFAKGNVESFNKLIDFVNQDMGPWGYFSYGKLFDKETELGYDRNEYKLQDYYDNQNEMIDCIKYVDRQSLEGDEESEDKE